MKTASHLTARWFLARLISTLKMEVIRSSEELVHIRATRRYISEDGSFQYFFSF
jgi:hypothetical protein